MLSARGIVESRRILVARRESPKRLLAIQPWSDTIADIIDSTEKRYGHIRIPCVFCRKRLHSMTHNIAGLS
jgi:hypothetical protein